MAQAAHRNRVPWWLRRQAAPVTLTPAGLERLRSLETKLGRTRSQIVDALLRGLPLEEQAAVVASVTTDDDAALAAYRGA